MRCAAITANSAGVGDASYVNGVALDMNGGLFRA
jgi:hypothetical protein